VVKTTSKIIGQFLLGEGHLNPGFSTGFKKVLPNFLWVLGTPMVWVWVNPPVSQKKGNQGLGVFPQKRGPWVSKSFQFSFKGGLGLSQFNFPHGFLTKQTQIRPL